MTEPVVSPAGGLVKKPPRVDLEKEACSSARISFSGGIEGRPMRA